jgi:hypothetical protein
MFSIDTLKNIDDFVGINTERSISVSERHTAQGSSIFGASQI